MKAAKQVGLSLVLVVGTLSAAAPAAASTLKVSSFPSGAQVIVDGVNTGKATPMSISLPDGDHVVTVQIPGSAWNPDTRVVTILPGNNDLSVTLLPAVTSGPPGPTGPAGAPASVRAASPGECATGGIVVTSGGGDVSLPVCNGAQGPQGIQGIDGVQGAQGATGPTGPGGPPGPAGPAGGVPAVDPTTLIGFGPNLFVDIGSGMGSFGLSPVSVVIQPIEVFDRGIQYEPGKQIIAPFAIASSNVEEATQLASWFALMRDGDSRSAARSVTFKLTDDAFIDRLVVQLDECRPERLDSDFAGSTRVVVDCRQVASVTASGDDVGFEDSVFLPAHPPLLQRLVMQGSEQVIVGLSGGGERWVMGHVALDPIRMRAGSVDEDQLGVSEIEDWIRGSVGTHPSGPFRDIGLRARESAPVVQYGRVLLAYIGLLDPARTVTFPSVGEEVPTTFIRIGFDLVLQPNSKP